MVFVPFTQFYILFHSGFLTGSFVDCCQVSLSCCDVIVTAGFLLLQNNTANLAADFSAIKELDSLSNEIVELQRWVLVANVNMINMMHFTSE